MPYHTNNYDFYALLAKGASNQELQEYDYFASHDSQVTDIAQDSQTTQIAHNTHNAHATQDTTCFNIQDITHLDMQDNDTTTLDYSFMEYLALSFENVREKE